ncbi:MULTISPECIES: thioredoxin domain-containing protein [Anaeromyxobacter]|uniref:DsbA family protein n=1 Tax=Anaeromyxobacter TaxID=161492 RepID=UPI001F56F698|nr:MULTISPECIES: thioredoxin domain-containing protein [unclassified Anaeromyxobacter]
MRARPIPLLAALAAAAAISACAARSQSRPGAAAAGAPATSTAPANADDPKAVLPGVDLEGLSPEQQRAVAEFALDEFCYCGCPHTVSSCLHEHESCAHAPRMASQAVRLARGGATKADILRQVTAYYAAFDRRAKLTVADFGPALGESAAPIALVEFSDFTCPYCRAVRPQLEAFVERHAGRVKLFYKPYPIESHPYAAEAAQAGEWAREKGLFWPMHDRIFGAEHALDVDGLADQASALGGDAEDLRAAIADGRYRARIEASQAEARDAGLRGTPTVFMNGRLLTDLSEEGLEQSLRDEEEWLQHRGWAHD